MFACACRRRRPPHARARTRARTRPTFHRALARDPRRHLLTAARLVLPVRVVCSAPTHPCYPRAPRRCWLRAGHPRAHGGCVLRRLAEDTRLGPPPCRCARGSYAAAPLPPHGCSPRGHGSQHKSPCGSLADGAWQEFGAAHHHARLQPPDQLATRARPAAARMPADLRLATAHPHSQPHTRRPAVLAILARARPRVPVCRLRRSGHRSSCLFSGTGSSSTSSHSLRCVPAAWLPPMSTAPGLADCGPVLRGVTTGALPAPLPPPTAAALAARGSCLAHHGMSAVGLSE